MRFEFTTKPDSTDIADLRAILTAFNRNHFETLEQTEMALYAKDEETLIGGINGVLFGNWLEIEYLAVAEKHRGKRIGEKLLRDLEQQAILRGAKFSFIYTFGFQAKDFYKKYGYQEVLTLTEYPLTGTEHYLIKNLITE
ncbi:GNAT family N-acetyltransferase [Listeria ilorinensis]|uniref:GNAT family N-acetyltransferase n=1 Tax=Listeria ilorinensis TaxID=2867439 RepID=UPI001EF668BB|nr:GNAT family N-acetyltransferase [Listeria ilorinensis]